MLEQKIKSEKKREKKIELMPVCMMRCGVVWSVDKGRSRSIFIHFDFVVFPFQFIIIIIILTGEHEFYVNKMQINMNILNDNNNCRLFALLYKIVVVRYVMMVICHGIHWHICHCMCFVCIYEYVYSLIDDWLNMVEIAFCGFWGWDKIDIGFHMQKLNCCVQRS